MPQFTCTDNVLKFGRVVFEICQRTFHHNTPNGAQNACSTADR